MGKILVDGSPVMRKRSGIGQYTHRLFDELMKIDTSNMYYFFALYFLGRQFKPPFSNIKKNVQYRLVRYLPAKVYNLISRRLGIMPIDLLARIHPDLVIFTNFVGSKVVSGSPSIAFIYDISYVTHRQYSDKKNAQLLTAQVPKTISRASQIITISQNAKKEIVKQYSVDPRKIEIIYPGVDMGIYYCHEPNEIEVVCKKYGVSHEYILFTGTLEPRKNILGILEAYSSLPTALQKRYQLVLAGGKGWLDSDIQKKLEELKELEIILTGYVPDEDLPALYSGATLFVYPSFYEGFGMPPLEAMACGVPVITSNNSSLPEVVGNAGIMVDAKDIKALVDSMKRVLTDNELAKKMRKAGLIQAKKFSWNTSATKMKEVINSIL